MPKCETMLTHIYIESVVFVNCNFNWLAHVVVCSSIVCWPGRDIDFCNLFFFLLYNFFYSWLLFLFFCDFFWLKQKNNSNNNRNNYGSANHGWWDTIWVVWVADYKNSLDKKRSETVEKEGGKRGNAKEKEKLWKKKKKPCKRKKKCHWWLTSSNLSHSLVTLIDN